MTFLWCEVLIAKDNLWFPTIHREIVIVELIQSRCTESCGVSHTESEIARSIHDSDLGSKTLVECLMVSQT